jgi:hypothetical protein
METANCSTKSSRVLSFPRLKAGRWLIVELMKMSSTEQVRLVMVVVLAWS